MLVVICINNIVLDDLIKIVYSYDIKALNDIRKAYTYASDLHDGQFRQSGEPYIVHPLNDKDWIGHSKLDRKNVDNDIIEI